MPCGPSTGTRVVKRHATKSTTAQSVFINCPFDEAYQPILRALVFIIVASGFRPRCALDSTDGAEIRVSKVAALIRDCDWAIHDLSRIEPNSDGIPRFNMPMELGLHLGARLFGGQRQRRKRALILDAQAHRYDAALSDISGQDIEVHNNSPERVIRCVRNWLSDHRFSGIPPLPGVAAMLSDYQLFQREAAMLLRKQRLDSLEELSHSELLWVVNDWITERARQLG
jgi:hypothetical protein